MPKFDEVFLITGKVVVSLLIIGILCAFAYAFLRGFHYVATTSSAASKDPCAELRELDPHCGWNPHWYYSGASINATDGTKSDFLSLDFK
jgi:hypothetical protein